MSPAMNLDSIDGRHVWVKDPDEAWVAGVVVDEGRTDAAASEAGKTRAVKYRLLSDPASAPASTAQVEESGEGPALKTRNLFDDDNADVRGYESVHDLTRLTHLHEPEILEALSVRFARDQIYTNTGPILLAVNPFKPLKLYSQDQLGSYYSAGLLRSQGLEAPALAPHVYAIADAAYRNLMDAPGAKTDQAILVSGESGAGKTETTKFVMSYLATVARSEGALEDHVADRVLESNPILESFGNARTMRNDNSSRFGKFIQMAFDAKGALVGAQIATYLLEKVRLAQQGPGERNFHVFYQMMAGASAEDRERWRLPAHPRLARYTNQSQVYDRRDQVLDEDQYQRTDQVRAARPPQALTSLTDLPQAFQKMHFSEAERNDVYCAAAAVLQLGNVEFAGEDVAVASSPDALQALQAASGLLAVSPEALTHALATRTITTGNETFVKQISAADAGVSRDALAKVPSPLPRGVAMCAAG
jgi:myosin-5